jgi:hypothetical protein
LIVFIKTTSSRGTSVSNVACASLIVSFPIDLMVIFLFALLFIVIIISLLF